MRKLPWSRLLLVAVFLAAALGVWRWVELNPRRAQPLPAPTPSIAERTPSSTTGALTVPATLQWGSYLTDKAVFSPDWKLLAQPYNSDILLLRASNAQFIRRLTGVFPQPSVLASPYAPPTASAIAFSPDQKLVSAVGTYHPKDEPRDIKDGRHEFVNTYLWHALWRVRDGRLLWSVKATRPYIYHHIQRKAQVRLQNDGTLLVAWELKDTPLWTLKAGRVLHEEPTPGSKSFGVFSPDGSRFAANGNPIKVFKREKSQFKPLPASLTYGGVAAWSPDNSLLAIDGGDAGVYRVADGARVWAFDQGSIYGGKGFGGPFFGFSPNGQWALTFNTNRHLLRQARDGEIVSQLPGQAHQFSRTTFSPSSTTLARFVGGDLWFHRVPEGTVLRKVTGLSRYVVSSAFSPDNKTLATVGEDLRLWDVASGRRLAVLPDDRESLASVHWSPNGQLIATGHDGEGNNGTLRVWNAKTRTIHFERETGTMSKLSSVRFSPDSTLIAVASPQFPAQIFEASNGRQVAVLGGGQVRNRSSQLSSIFHLRGKNPQSAVGWLPDDQTLLTAGDDGLSYWKRDGQFLRRHRDIANILNMSLSPRGDLVALGTSDSRLAVVRVADGQILWHWRLRSPYGTRLPEYQSDEVDVSFLPNGQVLSCLHGQTKLWDGQNGAALPLSLPPFISAYKYTFSSDGRFIAQTSLPGITLWRIGAQPIPAEQRGLRPPVKSSQGHHFNRP